MIHLCGILVHLSDHNSKKYQSILQFKKRVIAEEVSSISRVVDAPREIDSFGELAAKRITQAQKHFTPEEIEVLAAEYLEGKSTRELAKQFGCHRETVSRVLKKHGVKVRGRGHQSPI